MRIWSPQAMEIMNMAQKKASAMKHAELDPLHLLWAFLREATQPGENVTRAAWLQLRFGLSWKFHDKVRWTCFTPYSKPVSSKK